MNNCTVNSHLPIYLHWAQHYRWTSSKAILLKWKGISPSPIHEIIKFHNYEMRQWQRILQSALTSSSLTKKVLLKNLFFNVSRELCAFFFMWNEKGLGNKIKIWSTQNYFYKTKNTSTISEKQIRSVYFPFLYVLTFNIGLHCREKKYGCLFFLLLTILQNGHKRLQATWQVMRLFSQFRIKWEFVPQMRANGCPLPVSYKYQEMLWTSQGGEGNLMKLDSC